jgi:hypothetical protein
MSLPKDEQDALTQKAMVVKRTHQAELMTKANVVGVGIGFRSQRGVPTDQVALVVMVNRKVPKSKLKPKDLLPLEIEGIPVDVQEVGELKAQD